MFARLILLTILCGFSLEATASVYQWDKVNRVIAIGDVHGAFSELVSVLQAAQVIDTQLSWIGGATHLVSLGDLLDRGPQSAKVMDLLMRLQDEAQTSGGHVHVLLGNHEVMNLTGDLRDVSAPEFAALESMGGHARAFSLHGHYGRWLATLPFVIRINDSLFAHGGFSSVLRSTSLEEINRRARNALLTILDEGARLREEGKLEPTGDLLSATYNLTGEQTEQLGKAFVQASQEPLLGNLSPQWYRGTALCHKMLEEKSFASTLKHLGAKRGIMGHTPTPNREVNSRFSGTAFMIDTGMLASVYKGNTRAIEIIADRIRAFGPDGGSVIINVPKVYPPTLLDSSEYKIQQNNNRIVQLESKNGDEIFYAQFLKLNKRDRNRALAAYRLDRLLGLNMVPTTVVKKINGNNGIVLQWDRRALSERERATRGRQRPNYCEHGSDYQLLAAFDALIGKLDRSADNLWYDPATWRIRLAESHRAFGSKAALPKYATEPQLPPQMAVALKALAPSELSKLLAGLLKSAEIKALLKRRDMILNWPVSQS